MPEQRPTRDEIVALIAEAAAICNPRLAAAIAATGAETVLFGRNGTLDSLGLVTLIVAIEGELDARWGVALTLADERALSLQHSPFRTVGRLADYILGRL
ncbi:MAG: acyl carrier protein [Lentisphaeria bacterium]|jgi:acyl carrier protein